MSVHSSSPSEETPLLELDNDKAIEFVQKIRSESSLKWFIVFCNCFQWFATWCVITNLSTVEDSVSKKYNMSNIQFSTMFTVVYLLGIIAAVCTGPLLDLKCVKNVLFLELYGHIVLFVAQLLFFICCLLLENGKNQDLNHSSNTYILALMFISRIMMGVTAGFDEVLIMNINTLWFGKSKFLALSFMLSMASFEIGILAARYIPLPFINRFNLSLAYAFTIGLFFSFLAILLAICMIIAQEYHNNYIKRSRNITIPKYRFEASILEAFNKEKGFSKYTWIFLVYIAGIGGTYTTFLSQMTKPLMVKYDISEWNSDLLISVLDGTTVVLSPVFGIAIALAGSSYLLHFAVGGNTFLVISLIMYIFISKHASVSIQAIRWIMLMLFTCGCNLATPATYEIIYSTCLPSQINIVSTYIGTGTYLMSTVLTLLFGALSKDDHYNYSVGALLIVSCICFVQMLSVYLNQIRTHGTILYPIKKRRKCSTLK